MGTMNAEHTEESKRRDEWGRLSIDLYPRLFAMARYITGNDVHATEDLVQQTVLRCLKYAPDLEGVQEPWSYLRRLMRNVWLDSIQKHSEISLDDPLIGALPETEVPSVEPNILRALETEELMKTLRVSLGPLTVDEVQLLTLRFAGHSNDEIASMLEEDVQITRNKMNALMAKIRYRVKKRF
jgi:RNA polymerase sigma factor (sigma-70 family)